MRKIKIWRKAFVLFSVIVFFPAIMAGSAIAALNIPKILYVDSEEGFGMYEQAPSHRFLKGQKTMAYLEITGFTLQEEGDHYLLDLSMDLAVEDTEGNLLGTQKDIIQFQRNVKSRLHDVYFKVSFDFSLWDPGKYRLFFQVMDHLGGSFSKAELPLEIIPEE